MFGLSRKKHTHASSGTDGLVAATGALDRALMELLQELDCKRSDINPYEVSAFSMTFVSGVYLVYAKGTDQAKTRFLDAFAWSVPSRLLKVYDSSIGDQDYDEPAFLRLYQERYPVYSALIPNALSAESENGGIHLLMTIYECAVMRPGTPPMLKITLYQTAMIELLTETIRLVRERV